MLSLVLSEAYRWVKIGFASASIVFGVGWILYVIVQRSYGSETGILSMGMASLMVLTGIFLAFDSTKILRDLKRAVSDLYDTNNELRRREAELSDDIRELNTSMEQVANKFNAAAMALKKKNDAYAELLMKNEQQQNDFTEKMKSVEKTLNDRTKAFADTNEKLEDKVREMSIILEIAEKKNVEFGADIELLNIQIDNFVEQNRKLADENKKHADLNSQLCTEINDLGVKNHELDGALKKLSEERDQMTSQITSLTQLNLNMRVIIQTLAQTLDQSQELSRILNLAVCRIQTSADNIIANAQMMNKLVSGLRSVKFTQMDVNNDGHITMEEFEHAIETL